MNFLIISHALHKVRDEAVFSYAPYIREMNLWLKHVDSVTVIAPTNNKPINAIDFAYAHANVELQTIPSIEFTSILKSITSIIKTPYILVLIFIKCVKADHIHLRCPGNIGLLGSLVQILFPRKIKTAKYAGNWDAKAKQPLSYKFQRRILSNTFLTKNMQVLVYGEWENQTKNITSFFTASYSNLEIEEVNKRDYKHDLNTIFVGSLVKGKRPLLVIQMVEALNKQGKRVYLGLYGDGVLKKELMKYVEDRDLKHLITFHGNQTKDIVKNALKRAHFLILPSKSEGWPKAIAEAMFFGVIPISTSVSCVPLMLDNGNRGILIEGDLIHDLVLINNALRDTKKLELMSENAAKWSQLYTLDKFEAEIVKLLRS